MLRFIARLRPTILTCMLMFAMAASAQTAGWQILPNAGIPASARYEDIFFTDTLTGYAVNILGFGVSGVQKPIYKTTDGGSTWIITGPVCDGSTALRSIEFLGDKATGVVGSLFGTVYRTADYGTTWTDISASIADTATDTLPAGRRNICGWAHYGNSFYGVGWWGANVARFYKSTDKGITWTTTYIDTTLATGLVDAVFTSADTGFVTGGRNVPGGAYSAPSDESVVLRTTDGGNTWTKVFSDTTIGGRVWKIQSLGHGVLVGAIEPYYYPDTVCMIRSADGGDSWSVIAAGSVTSNISGYGGTQGIGFVSPLTGWLGGYYDGIWQTWDGGSTRDKLAFGTNLNRFFVVDDHHVFAAGPVPYKWSSTFADTQRTAAPTTLQPPHQLCAVAPNPAADRIKIEFDLYAETNVKLQVVNVTGRRHFTIAEGRMQCGHHLYFWDGTDMPAGPYLLWLGTDEIPLTQKFTLVH